ncbi:uncharacterized protein LOC144619460 [Crassostrea virginica]
MWTAKMDTNQRNTSRSLSSLTKTNLKRQRGRQRTGSESFKKVSFDEESLQSASSQFSRSDGELWPQKQVIPTQRRYQKKRTSSQSSVESPRVIRSTMTSTPLTLLNFDQKIHRHPVDKDLNTSIDEGFSDTFEKDFSRKKRESNISVANSSKSDSFDGVLKGDQSKEMNSSSENVKPQQSKTSLGGGLYIYSSSDSEDNASVPKMEEKKPTAKRQVGRRGRLSPRAEASSLPVPTIRETAGFVIEDLESEPGSRLHRGLSSPKGLSKNYKIAPSDKLLTRRAFSEETSEENAGFRNNEAILLEKYIIRKSDSDGSYSPREQIVLIDTHSQQSSQPDNILQSNLGPTPGEFTLRESVGYDGFAAGPRSTSSTSNIPSERETTGKHTACTSSPQSCLEGVSMLDSSLTADSAETGCIEAGVDVEEEDRCVRVDPNYALTNSTASILSLTSEEGSAIMDDFLQDYDHEPCVRRARSVTFDHGIKESVDVAPVSKKVRFSSEDNLVYELRHGFSDEEKSSESSQRLELDFLDDCPSEDPLSELTRATPSLPRYFSDSDGSSSSCTPDSSPRSPQTEPSTEDSQSHRTLLQRSLQKPADGKPWVEEEQTSRIEEEQTSRAEEEQISRAKEEQTSRADGMPQAEEEQTSRADPRRDLLTDNIHQPEESIVYETSAIPCTYSVNSDVSSIGIPNLGETEGETCRDKVEACSSILDGKGTLDVNLTPLKLDKGGIIREDSNVCRSLFTDAEIRHNESSQTPTIKAATSTSEVIPKNNTVIFDRFCDKTSGLTDNEFKRNMTSKSRQSEEQSLDIRERDGTIRAMEFVSVTPPCSSDNATHSGNQALSYALSSVPDLPFRLDVTDGSTCELPDRSTCDLPNGSISGQPVISTFETPVSLTSHGNFSFLMPSSQNDGGSGQSADEAKAAPVSPQGNQLSSNDEAKANLLSPLPSKDISVSISAESHRSSTFVVFQSTSVDKVCLESKTKSGRISSKVASTEGTTKSTPCHTIVCSPLVTLSTSNTPPSSIISPEVSPAAGVSSPPQASGVTSHSAFSNWNWQPTPVKPLTFIPPKKNTSKTSTQRINTEKVPSPDTLKGINQIEQPPNHHATFIKAQNSQLREPQFVGSHYESTAEWVLSHSERFVSATDQGTKLENQRALQNTTASKVTGVRMGVEEVSEKLKPVCPSALKSQNENNQQLSVDGGKGNTDLNAMEIKKQTTQSMSCEGEGAWNKDEKGRFEIEEGQRHLIAEKGEHDSSNVTCTVFQESKDSREKVQREYGQFNRNAGLTIGSSGYRGISRPYKSPSIEPMLHPGHSFRESPKKKVYIDGALQVPNRRTESKAEEQGRRTESKTEEQGRRTESKTEEQGRRTESKAEEQLKRTDSKAEEQGRSTESKAEEQGRRTESKAEEQARRTDSKVEEQARRTDSKVEEQDRRIESKEKGQLKRIESKGEDQGKRIESMEEEQGRRTESMVEKQREGEDSVDGENSADQWERNRLTVLNSELKYSQQQCENKTSIEESDYLEGKNIWNSEEKETVGSIIRNDETSQEKDQVPGGQAKDTSLSRGKKQKMSTKAVPLDESENSDVEEEFRTEESSSNSRPEAASKERRRNSQAEPPMGRRGIPSMLPRTLSGKRLSCAMIRPESPESVYILSEIFLAILIFLVSMIFLFL